MATRHMIGEWSMFLNLKSHEGIISFEGSGKEKIINIGKVGKHCLPTINNSSLKIDLEDLSNQKDYPIFLEKLIFFVKHVKKQNKSNPKRLFPLLDIRIVAYGFF
ncbi:hypothetical protein CR513_37612, partial [Mucuna pruriens]